MIKIRPNLSSCRNRDRSFFALLVKQCQASRYVTDVTQLQRKCLCLLLACAVNKKTDVTGTFLCYRWTNSQNIPLLKQSVSGDDFRLLFHNNTFLCYRWVELNVFYFFYICFCFPILLLIVFAVVFRQLNKSWNCRKPLRFIRDFSLRMLDDQPVYMI